MRQREETIHMRLREKSKNGSETAREKGAFVT
jgi:hypothetical protein